ncbi:MAG: GNAT family N-acetyltransferase [Gammaproteobacteria bacterium]|nr:GNAT family N-acetyltransferase [Gammaproteobacteria bacterium]
MNRYASNSGLQIRLIETDDNSVVAAIIRQVMTEFQAVGRGYSINDSEINDMYTAYAMKGSAFYVASLHDRVLGCGGFGPLTGGDKEVCELRKMYFKSELRGMGVGAKLLKLCLKEATRAGFKRCYLETIDSMEQARRLYGNHGFRYLDKPMGDTGHSSCGTWMVKDL